MKKFIKFTIFLIPSYFAITAAQADTQSRKPLGNFFTVSSETAQTTVNKSLRDECKALLKNLEIGIAMANKDSKNAKASYGKFLSAYGINTVAEVYKNLCK